MENFDLETQVKRDDIGNLEYKLEPENLRAAHLPTFSSAEMNFKTAPVVVESIVKTAKSGILVLRSVMNIIVKRLLGG